MEGTNERNNKFNTSTKDRGVGHGTWDMQEGRNVENSGEKKVRVGNDTDKDKERNRDNHNNTPEKRQDTGYPKTVNKRSNDKKNVPRRGGRKARTSCLRNESYSPFNSSRVSAIFIHCVCSVIVVFLVSACTLFVLCNYSTTRPTTQVCSILT